MKNYLLPLLLCVSSIQLFAQKNTPYAPNGGVFTPRGTLRVLLVFARFTDAPKTNPNFDNTQQSVDLWNKAPLGLPDYVNPVTGECPDFMFNKVSDFERFKNDDSKTCISKYWNTMSLPKSDFKLIGESFALANGQPTVVDIDPTGSSSWSAMNAKVIERMRLLNPAFDYKRFDQRRNNPSFNFDNSDTLNHKPDGVVDYVIFIYRYNNTWTQQPAPAMERWTGSGGGYAAISNAALLDKNADGTRLSEGFTLPLGMGIPTNLIMHEIAHSLFNCPHFFGANGTIGNYFYSRVCGWSSTSGLQVFQCFSAWERWYLGYIEPQEPLINRDTSFALNDFVTEGDAIRLEIPFSKGQHLWIEHHQKQSIFDTHPWRNSTIDADGSTLSDSPAGIYLTVENCRKTRQVINSAISDDCNSLSLIHANGNYDYYRRDTSISNNWGNTLFFFSRGEANPLAGINPFYYFRDDYNKDGIIFTDINFNGAPNNEGYGKFIAREEISMDDYQNRYDCFGVYNTEKSKAYARSAAFHPGDHLDMSTNPSINALCKYSMKTLQMDTLFLNGLAINFTGTQNDPIVNIQYKQTTLKQSTRYCGNVALPNISGDQAADLVVPKRVKLLINKSGTNNRHKKTEAGDFINPTSFTLRAGSTMRLQKRSTLVIDDATFTIEKGAKLIIEKGAKLKIKASATFINNGVVEKVAK